MAKKFILKPTIKDKNDLSIDYQSELNEQQQKAVTSLNGPQLIIAGAGTGKTRTLVYRVAYLVESGIKPESILYLPLLEKLHRKWCEGQLLSLMKGVALPFWL